MKNYQGIVFRKKNYFDQDKEGRIFIKEGLILCLETTEQREMNMTPQNNCKFLWKVFIYS